MKGEEYGGGRGILFRFVYLSGLVEKWCRGREYITNQGTISLVAGDIVIIITEPNVLMKVEIYYARRSSFPGNPNQDSHSHKPPQ